MDLTPLKIPGKRRQPRMPAANPLRKGTRRTTKPKPQNTLKAKGSWLERLPLEILEPILWYSGNANLALSSPRIGKILSGASTRRETFISAFEPTWDAWFNQVKERGTNLCVQGDPNFQSDLLEYSWTTITFILECWDLYVQRRAKRQLKKGEPFHVQHVRIWGDPDDLTKAGVADDDVLIDPKKASLCFLHDYAAFRRIELINDEEKDRLKYAGEDATFFLVHKDTRIPTSLLTSPWDDEVRQKLFWLVRGGARLAEDQTWEDTLQGYHHAVPTFSAVDSITPDSITPDHTAVRLLDVLNAFRNWPTSHLMKEFQRIQPALKQVEACMETGQVHGLHHIEAILMCSLAPSMMGPPSRTGFHMDLEVA
ncbi:hypothetical protein F4677DRAFT_442054 [Hypoxylon crocopeplum]|nr:hypothetical protein F4677DRAFT_442054 [Hypoxylon crocopeplum]